MTSKTMIGKDRQHFAIKVWTLSPERQPKQARQQRQGYQSEQAAE
jgi:hypothetical protein